MRNRYNIPIYNALFLNIKNHNNSILNSNICKIRWINYKRFGIKLNKNGKK